MKELSKNFPDENKYRMLFSAVADSATDAIIITDHQGEITYWNAAAEKMFGYPSKEAIGQELHRLIVPEKYYQACSSGFSQFRKTGTGKVIGQKVELSGIKKNGVEFPIELSVSAIRIKGLWYAVGMVHDITERKLAEETIQRKLDTERILLDISSRFVRKMNINDAITASLAQVGTFTGANHSILFLFTDNGTIIEDIYEWCSQELKPLGDVFRGLSTETFSWWMTKLYRGEAICISNVSKLPSEAQAEREILEGLNIKSLLVFPLTIGEQLAGFIGFGDANPLREWNDEYWSLLRLSSEIIGSALERKRAEEVLQRKNHRMLRDLEQAAMVQRELLPKELPILCGVNFAWEFKPSVYVAGDMFNIFQLDDKHIGFYMLDVMGHGIPAALKAVTLSFLLKPSPYTGPSVYVPYTRGENNLLLPSQTLRMLNEHFTQESFGGGFITIFYGVLETSELKLTFARAGHYPPVVISSSGEIQELRQGGSALGLLKGANFEDYVVYLNPRDKVFLYTDGIVEARDRKKIFYTKNHFIDFLIRNRKMTIAELTFAAVQDVVSHIGDEAPGDDLTLLGIEIAERS
ncbi:MAG: SpoIIE family protein phosphatase [Bacillota bacterium]